ncbi:MAG: exonuclease subunit SbcD [Streptosporangiales bacterium]|nr:exonuclease subunit SbcD [Streptosporangiales bacterium]
MKILHTADWHVGKVLKGRARTEEHARVLREVIDVAERERPDLVLVAGDLYDTAAPAADSVRVVTRALTALRRTGAEVVAVAGNHDNGAQIDALRPWADAAGVRLVGQVAARPEQHLLTGETRDGEPWRLVALPFLSQRHAVRAAEMFDLSTTEATQTYADWVRRLVERLTEPFESGEQAVNLVTGHLTVSGGALGGGERDAHTIFPYHVPASVFPASCHYVALGHLHRQQEIAGPCPVRYSGSPLQVDFGEEANEAGVLLVDVAPATPARVTVEPITSGTALRTVRGTLDEVSALADNTAGAWLRVLLRERPRAGLREAVQELLPDALEVRVDPEFVAGSDDRQRAVRTGRTPGQLFAAYLEERGHDDTAVKDLFERLYDEVS